jgi:hypothetical protein
MLLFIAYLQFISVAIYSLECPIAMISFSSLRHYDMTCICLFTGHEVHELSMFSSGMASSWMLRRVALVRTDVSEGLSSSETSVLTRATRRNTPEDAILHSHRRENLKSCMFS